MKYLLLSACAFGVAIFLARGGLGGLGGTSPVTFQDRTAGVTFVHRMTAFAEPETLAGLTVEGVTGPQPLLAEGEVTIVTAWASWCGYCRRELPELLVLRRDTGVALRAVSTEPRDGMGEIGAYLARNDLRQLAALRDAGGVLAPHLGGRGVPTSLVVDRYGQVVGRFVGTGPWRSEKVRAWLKALMAAQSPEESLGLLRDFTG